MRCSGALLVARCGVIAMTDGAVLVCCPVCGAPLSSFGSSSFPLSDGVRVWSCPACGASGYAPWPASCRGRIVCSSLGSFAPAGFVGLDVDRPMRDCLVPWVRPADFSDELVLGRSGRLWDVFALSGVPVGFARRDGLRVDVWHVLRPGRVSSCYLEGELDDVAYCRDWIAAGASGAVPVGAFVGR